MANRLAIHQATVLERDAEHVGVTVIARDGAIVARRGRDTVASATVVEVRMVRRNRLWRVEVDDGPAWIIRRHGGCGACNESIGPLASYR